MHTCRPQFVLFLCINKTGCRRKIDKAGFVFYDNTEISKSETAFSMSGFFSCVIAQGSDNSYSTCKHHDYPKCNACRISGLRRFAVDV